MPQLRKSLLAALVGVMMAACGTDEPTGTSSSSLGPPGERLYEAYCTLEDFQPPKRHTIILVDENALTRSNTASEFITENSSIRDIVQSFASPRLSIESGITAPRERVSMYIMSADGTAGSRIFTGCIPSFSSVELAAMRAETSSVETFFKGDVVNEIEEAERLFEGLLVASLRGAAENISDSADASRTTLQKASFFRSLRASGNILDADLGLPRVVMITNLGTNTVIENIEEGSNHRSAAINAASELNMDLGLSDIMVVQPDGANEDDRSYVSTFLLAQNGRLVYWGDGRPSSVEEPAQTVHRYIGNAVYPSGPESIHIRIGMDANGQLVQSWLVLRGSPADRATPMTGQAVCRSESNCEIRSDDGGFAQAWSLGPDGEIAFDNAMPFGGLRDFNIAIQDDRLTGSLSDPAIDQIGPDPANNTIELDAQLQPSAKF